MIPGMVDPHHDRAASAGSRDDVLVALPPSIQATGNTVFLVDRSFTMVAFNPAYLDFARANGGDRIARDWGIGCDVLACVPAVMDAIIRPLYVAALDGHASAIEYQCHAPTLFRTYRMRLIPFPNAMVLSEHSLIVQRPHAGNAAPLDDALLERYRDQRGLITQCSNCGKLRQPGGDRWDWVTGSLTTHDVSHGLCAVCLEHLHPE